MGKKVASLPLHLYWYYFPGTNEPQRIEKSIIPRPPYERFELKSDCESFIATHVNGYCSGYKHQNGDPCRNRFECAKFSKFFEFARGGKFKGMYSGDIFRRAPFEEKSGVLSCKEFESKIKT